MAEFSVDNKVIVTIFGEDYPLTAGGDSAEISKIAAYVDSRMNEVAGRSRSQARDKVAILTAMSLASELMDNSSGSADDQKVMSEGMDRLLVRLDQAISDN